MSKYCRYAVYRQNLAEIILWQHCKIHRSISSLTLWCPAAFGDFHTRTTGLHMALRARNSGAESAREQTWGNCNRQSWSITIDHSFFSNRNRLKWPKMKCNRLHCQFNRNRRLISRLNLEIFTLHHCVMNHSCGSWVSSFIIICYGCVSGKAIYPSTWFKSRQSRGKHSISNKSRLCFQLAFRLAARSNVVSLVRHINKNRSSS